MATYIVFTRESTRNAAELETYSEKVGPTLSGHPVDVLAAYGRQEVLEGPQVEGVAAIPGTVIAGRPERCILEEHRGVWPREVPANAA